MTATVCQRCKTPNPYLDQTSSNFETVQTTFFDNQPNKLPPSVAINYAGARTATTTQAPTAFVVLTNNRNNYQYFLQNVIDAIVSALQSVTPRKKKMTALEAAEKDIRWAWKTGRIDISLTAGLGVQQIFWTLPFTLDSDFVLEQVFLMIIYLSINAALIYGIYRKSRICASIVFGLQCFAVFTYIFAFLLTPNLQIFAMLLYGSLFGYFYALGARATFRYNRLAKP